MSSSQKHAQMMNAEAVERATSQNLAETQKKIQDPGHLKMKKCQKISREIGEMIRELDSFDDLQDFRTHINDVISGYENQMDNKFQCLIAEQKEKEEKYKKMIDIAKSL